MGSHEAVQQFLLILIPLVVLALVNEYSSREED